MNYLIVYVLLLIYFTGLLFTYSVIRSNRTEYIISWKTETITILGQLKLWEKWVLLILWPIILIWGFCKICWEIIVEIFKFFTIDEYEK